MLAMYGVTSNRLAPVNEAVRLTPSDPEVQVAQARALLNAGQLTAALPAFERAVALQPRNFGLWAELGNAYDLAGKSDEAITTVKQAVRLAPAYAQPHWQLGNLLLRKGRRREAFTEFRATVNADASLFPNTVDLAWGAFNGEASAIEQAIHPNNDVARLELAKVFAAHGAVEDAILTRARQLRVQDKSL